MPSSKYLQPSPFEFLRTNLNWRHWICYPAAEDSYSYLTLVSLTVWMLFLFHLSFCSEGNIYSALLCCLFPIKIRGAALSCMRLRRNRLAVFREARWVLLTTVKILAKLSMWPWVQLHFRKPKQQLSTRFQFIQPRCLFSETKNSAVNCEYGLSFFFCFLFLTAVFFFFLLYVSLADFYFLLIVVLCRFFGVPFPPNFLQTEFSNFLCICNMFLSDLFTSILTRVTLNTFQFREIFFPFISFFKTQV